VFADEFHRKNPKAIFGVTLAEAQGTKGPMHMGEKSALTLLPISVVSSLHDFAVHETPTLFGLNQQQYLKQPSYSCLFVHTAARKSVGLLGHKNCDFGFSRLSQSILMPR
jgi:hypothetical protein